MYIVILLWWRVLLKFIVIKTFPTKVINSATQTSMIDPLITADSIHFNLTNSVSVLALSLLKLVNVHIPGKRI